MNDIRDVGPCKMSLGNVLISPFRLLPKYPIFLFPPLMDIVLKSTLTVLLYLISLLYISSPFSWLADPNTLQKPTEFPWHQGLIGMGITVIGWIIGFFLITVFTSGWISAMFNDMQNLGKIGIRSSLEVVIRRLWALIRYVLLACSLILIMFCISAAGLVYSMQYGQLQPSRGSFFLCGCIFLIIIVIALGWIYGSPAIIKDKCGAIKGMMASWKFVWSGNFWRTIAIFLITLLCALLIVLFLPYGYEITCLMATFLFPLLLPYAYFTYGDVNGNRI